MAKNFEPQLCPSSTRWAGGYAGGPISLTKLADEVYGKPLDGAWLTCYMLRRFGWPNIGTDDHKDLCGWMLTTSVAGLFLVVIPYFGSGGNYHFAVRFDKETGVKLDADPGRESYHRRRVRAITAWWDRHGSKLYALGEGQKEGDEDELVHLWGEQGDVVSGLWRRPLKADRPPDNLPPDASGMLMWWLGTFIEQKHPEVKLPKPTAREREHRETAFIRRAKAALQATMCDLLRPIHVRDIGFNPTGRGEGEGEEAGRFDGAGNTPEYWFSARAKRERKAAKTA